GLIASDIPNLPTVTGSSLASGTITIKGTSHATKGKILFGTSAYDEVNNRLGIGTATPSDSIGILGAGSTGGVTLGNLNQDLLIGNPASTSSKFRLLPYGGDIYFDNFYPSGTSAAGAIIFRQAWAQTGLERMRIDTSGRLGIGITAPTATIHIKAGTATAGSAPIKLTAGTNLTTPEAGAFEYSNTLFFTNSDAIRRHIVTAANSTKVTAGAPLVNDGYVTVNIGGVNFNLMTTA
ncbi:MAG: hypothetical protein WKF91_21410, partial [Segetibacter sp.]